MTQNQLIRRPSILLAACTCAYLGSLAYSGTRLPERVASHFDFAGRANAWMGRSTYLLAMAALGLALPGLFLSMAWLVRRLPVDLVNLPNRHYWLSPEHRDATSAELARRFVWLASLVLAFFMIVNLLVVDANQRNPAQLSNAIWAWMAIFLLTTFAWLASLVRYFSRVPAISE